MSNVRQGDGVRHWDRHLLAGVLLSIAGAAMAAFVLSTDGDALAFRALCWVLILCSAALGPISAIALVVRVAGRAARSGPGGPFGHPDIENIP